MGNNNRKESKESELDERQALEDLLGNASSELTVQNEFRNKIATAMVSNDRAVIVTFVDTRGGVESIPAPTTQNVQKLSLVFDTVPAAKEAIEPTIDPVYYQRFKHLSQSKVQIEDSTQLESGRNSNKVSGT